MAGHNNNLNDYLSANNPIPSLLYITSYNLHGLNQGGSLLNDICHYDNVSVIFIQESWITPMNLDKLRQFSNKFAFYGISAMEDVVSNCVLRGRPYGGVGMLIRSNYTHLISYYVCRERYVLLVIGNTVLINIYLPSVISHRSVDIIQALLDEIDTELINFPDHIIILGGDLNVSLKSSATASLLMKEFMSKHILCNVNDSFPDNIDFTYFHESLQHYSYIDYLIISSNVLKSVLDFKILESPINLSDHNPICIKLNTSLLGLDSNSIVNSASDKEPNRKSQQRLRWDKAKLQNYYSLTRETSQPISNSLCAEYNELMANSKSVNKQMSSIWQTTAIESIDRHYSSLVRH